MVGAIRGDWGKLMEGRIVYLTSVPNAEHINLFCNQPDMMDVKKAAELLGVDERTIRREISRGALRCARVGKCVRISKRALLEYVGEVSE